MSNLEPEQLQQRKKIQMEIMLKDSDVKKNERLMLDAEIAMRELKHKMTQLQSDFIVKEGLVKKLSAEHVQLQVELVKLKHQMNNIGR